MTRIYETKLKKASPNLFCGDLRLAIINYGFDEAWLKRILDTEANVSNYSLIGLHIHDEDDFGGVKFYAVPFYEVEKICNVLIKWAKEIREIPVWYFNFFEEGFQPSFSNIKDYFNW